MPTEISWDIRERAEGLYIVDGLTYAQVSQRTGVSVTQLQRWAADGQWTERRREYRRELSDIRRGTVQLRAKLLRKVLDAPAPDPQDVYAFARIEQVAAAAAAKGRPETAQGALSEAIPPREINTPQEAAAALQEALSLKINAMLVSPEGIDLAAVKEAKACMELIETLSHTPATAPSGGTAPDGQAPLTSERLRAIIREQYGV